MKEKAKIGESKNNGLGLCIIFQIILVLLKVTGDISCSWWAVFLPLEIYAGLVLILLTVTITAALISVHKEKKE